MRKLGLFAAALAALAVLASGATAQNITRSHGSSLVGDLLYPADFPHWNYVNPNAPKGGDVVQFSIGDFDSFNPWILEGRPAAGVGGIWESLMQGNSDEDSAHYGFLAEWMEFPEDLSWVTFKLRDEAHWWDGQPITPEDVIWTLEALQTDGHPFYGQYWGDLERAEDLGGNQVRIYFNTDNLNRELPHIAGQLPVLPKHYYETVDFTETTLEPPMGSGPYRIKTFDTPSSITWERVPDYWGVNLPANIGLNNFDTIRFDYYLDQTIALEAFKAGEYDFRGENNSKMWAVDYVSPALEQGLIIQAMIPLELPQGMQGFFLNTRQPQLQDRKVREALQYTFDYQWTNNTLFYGQYTRTRSFFENSELVAFGTPSALELEYLEPHRAALPAELFTTEYQPPVTDGTGNNRAQLQQAQLLLAEAGWTVTGGAGVGLPAEEETAESSGIDTQLATIAVVLLAGAIGAYLLLRTQSSGVRNGVTIVLAGAFVVVGYMAMQGDESGVEEEVAEAPPAEEGPAGRLVNAAGEQMKIEFLLISPAFERIVGPVVQNMQRLGIDASQRTVETAQYQERVQTFDFDVVVSTVRQSISPGNEQRGMWGCESADTEGGGNLSGICSPVVEDMIDKIIEAPDRAHLIAASQALDRVLQWNYYVVPNWHIRASRMAYWNKFDRPDTPPKLSAGTETWWVDAAKAEAVRQGKSQLGN